MVKIMIADDEPDIIRDLHTALDDKGFEFVDVTYGQAVLDTILDRQPDLLLVDWMLPDLTGVEVTKRIRRHRDFKEIAKLPIIGMTSLATQENIAKFIDAGADDGWVKSFKKEGIAELVAKISPLTM